MVALSACCASTIPVSDRITVTVRGKGPDVVLIPGLACSNAVWDATVRHLEGHYRVHLIQVDGFAGAPARGNAQGAIIGPTVDAIDAYIKTNNLKSPKIIGHSLGGLMGLVLTIRYPDDVGKLMVVDSLPFFGALMGARDSAAAVGQASRARDRILNASPEEYARSEKDYLHFLVKSPEGLELASQWALASDKSVVARGMYEVMTTDVRPRLHEIKTPVTILYPWDSSSGMPQDNADRLYLNNFDSLPNKTLVRIDGSYHFIMFDQPSLFASQVDSFLE